MYKPSEAPRGGRLAALTGVSLVAIAGVLLQMPVGATVGIANGADDRVPASAATPVPAAAPAPARSGGSYQLRCWQYGKLLFDEAPVTLSTEARVGARMVATDRNGTPLFITEAGSATCLARPAAAPPSPAMPR